MEDLTVYDADTDSVLWINEGNYYTLDQLNAEYPIEQAIPMGDEWLATIRKLQYMGQTVYVYHVFHLVPAELNAATGEIVRPAYWSFFDTIHMTEGLSFADFSSLAVGDLCTELFEICPIAKVDLAEQGDIWSYILLPEGLLKVRVQAYDNTADWACGPVSQYADQFYIHTIELISYDNLGREGLNVSSLLTAFVSADYVLLPD